MPSTKPKINAYLEPALMRQVSALAARRRVAMSAVVEAAVASFFSADSAERQEAALSRRLDRIGRQLERLERDQRIALETLAVFVRYWLMATPSLPPSTQPAAHVAGRERYHAFVEAVAREVAKGVGFGEVVARDIGHEG